MRPYELAILARRFAAELMIGWKFKEPPNLAVLTTWQVLNQVSWIARVSHDADDGGWQFHGPGSRTESDAAVVSLRSIVELDPSVAEVADLPVGWCAFRDAPTAPWCREKKP